MTSLTYILRGLKKVEKPFLFELEEKVLANTRLYCVLPRET